MNEKASLPNHIDFMNIGLVPTEDKNIDIDIEQIGERTKAKLWQDLSSNKTLLQCCTL